MERLLIEKFLEEENIDDTPMTPFHIGETCDPTTLGQVLQDQSTLSVIRKYMAFEEKVQKGHLGKTAIFWLSFINHT